MVDRRPHQTGACRPWCLRKHPVVVSRSGIHFSFVGSSRVSLSLGPVLQALHTHCISHLVGSSLRSLSKHFFNGLCVGQRDQVETHNRVGLDTEHRDIKDGARNRNLKMYSASLILVYQRSKVLIQNWRFAANRLYIYKSGPTCASSFRSWDSFIFLVTQYKLVVAQPLSCFWSSNRFVAKPKMCPMIASAREMSP
jgi:hypothetical protein